MTKREKKTQKATDAQLDEALEGTFPASDPPSQTNPSKGTPFDPESLDEWPVQHGRH